MSKIFYIKLTLWFAIFIAVIGSPISVTTWQWWTIVIAAWILVFVRGLEKNNKNE